MVSTTSSESSEADTTAPRASTRRGKADTTCAAAHEVARLAVADTEGADRVGEHLEVVAEADRVVTHYFQARVPGYLGWRWAVTVTRAPRARRVTVNDVVLLPGPEAVVAPQWVPWQDRLEPGDLQAGGVLPVARDDERLVPGWADPDDSGRRVGPPGLAPGSDVADLVTELWLSRDRVLSVLGREQAAERWHEGEAGPTVAHADAATYSCITCGFAVPLAGSLGQFFAACANANSPSDGRVVAADHGCGGHSRITPDSLASTVKVTPVAHTSDDMEHFAN